jgi:hypothetical protein
MSVETPDFSFETFNLSVDEHVPGPLESCDDDQHFLGGRHGYSSLCLV